MDDFTFFKIYQSWSVNPDPDPNLSLKRWIKIHIHVYQVSSEYESANLPYMIHGSESDIG